MNEYYLSDSILIDLSVSKWAMEDGKMQRILKYWMPVSNPIGMFFNN